MEWPWSFYQRAKSHQQKYGGFFEEFGNPSRTLAHQLFGRTYSNLPSNTERNPREKVNAITLRNGRELEEVEKDHRERVKKDKKVMDETPKRDESESSKSVPIVKFASEVKAYKPKVHFPARLV